MVLTKKKLSGKTSYQIKSKIVKKKIIGVNKNDTCKNDETG